MNSAGASVCWYIKEVYMAFEKFPYSNFHDLNLDWIIQQVNEWAAEWAEVKQAYEEFEVDLSQIEAHLAQLDNKDIFLENQIGALNTLIEALDQRLSNTISSLTDFEDVVNYSLNDLDDRLQYLEQYATFYMYSPFTGLYVPLTEVITELAQYHLEDALTAAEYDALALSATYYDTKQLTAIEYDATGKVLLP